MELWQMEQYLENNYFPSVSVLINYIYVRTGMCNSMGGGKIKTEIVNICFQGINLTVKQSLQFHLKGLQLT